ncbi:MAG: DUF2911 domain-containing protein [Ekhidna sp.]
MKRLFLPCVFCIFIFTATAQILVKLPEPSKYAKVEQHIGFTEISIEYSRPNIGGRNLFGEMIPYGKIWRTGANANTKIQFSKDVFLEGNLLKKGKYALYTIPDKDSWTIVINSDTTLWGHYGYKDSLDVVRFKVTPTTSSNNIESMLFSFRDLTQLGGFIDLEWGNFQVPIKLEIDWESQDQEIISQIDSVLALPLDRDRPTIVAYDYLRSAMYYLENDYDLEKALTWINKAIELELVSYFPLYKAEILAKLKRYSEALEASKQGLAIFMKTGKNKEWIWRYEKQIEEYSKKL